MEDILHKPLSFKPFTDELETLKSIISGFEGWDNVALFLLNLQTGNYDHISQSIEKITGYPIKQFHEKGMEFFVSIIHPDDYPMVLKEHVRYMKILEKPDHKKFNGGLNKCEFRIQHVDSKWLWLACHSFIIDYEENNGIVLGILQEINGRKEKEKFLWKEIMKREPSNDIIMELTKSYNSISPRPVNDKKIKNGPDKILSLALYGHHNEKLSEREKEVLKFIAQGFSSKQLANELNISKHTAISHRKHLLEKFKVKNTAELIKEASKSFWLD